MADKQVHQWVWELMDQATFAPNLSTRAKVVQELANHPEEVLAALAGRLYLAKKHRNVASEVLGIIGYPENAATVPMLIGIATDPNSPGMQQATVTLAQVGPDVVIPYLIEILWDCGRTRLDWQDEVNDICWWLRRAIKDRAYLLRCGPVIASLLSRRVLGKDQKYQNDLEEALIAALEAIGPEGADYALPALLISAEHAGLEELRKQALQVITSFESERLQPYERILRRLSGESGKVP